MTRQTNGTNRPSQRGNRIASKVQTIVAEILRDKFSDDPVIAAVSLVGSDAHGGLSFTRLYYYTHTDPKITQERLDEITKTVRYELAARLNQKYTPEIRFTYDDTIERANRIEELLKNL
jgi:ribosome-binding factor A